MQISSEKSALVCCNVVARYARLWRIISFAFVLFKMLPKMLVGEIASVLLRTESLIWSGEKRRLGRGAVLPSPPGRRQTALLLYYPAHRQPIRLHPYQALMRAWELAVVVYKRILRNVTGISIIFVTFHCGLSWRLSSEDDLKPSILPPLLRGERSWAQSLIFSPRNLGSRSHSQVWCIARIWHGRLCTRRCVHQSKTGTLTATNPLLEQGVVKAVGRQRQS